VAVITIKASLEFVVERWLMGIIFILSYF
jgi:hypothetical protein